jgi:hypothetical protein
MSMAAGKYVSVSSQSDTEQADLARERKELSENAEFELDELAEIYVKRGVDQPLARQVAQQLMAKDALTAHARDELGISEITTAHPVQAALTSAVMFSVGAAMPLVMVVVSPASALVPIVSAEIASREISDNMLLRIVISLGKSTAALRDEALIKQLEASGARGCACPLLLDSYGGALKLFGSRK